MYVKYKIVHTKTVKNVRYTPHLKLHIPPIKTNTSKPIFKLHEFVCQCYTTNVYHPAM